MRKKKSCNVIVLLLLECDHLIMHYSASLMSTVILLNIFILLFVPFSLSPSIGYVKMV